MAVDGTHLPICVSLKDTDRYRGRKGITQNVMAACSFDLVFTYVLSGWEGAAADEKVFADALQRGYTIQEGKYDLADAGFALTPYMITPYRQTRYHLKEFLQGTKRYDFCLSSKNSGLIGQQATESQRALQSSACFS